MMISSKYLKDLPQYHFERDDFIEAFRKVFTFEELYDLEVMCGYPMITDNLCYAETLMNIISSTLTAEQSSIGISI